MAEWNWEKEKFLKGTGIIIKKGFAIVKFTYIDELKFRIKGKLSGNSKGTETAKDILYFELGVEEIGTRHLPVSFVEIILNSLWEINIDSLSGASMNGKPLKRKKVLLDLGRRIKDGTNAKKVYLKVLGTAQKVDVNLDFDKKGVKGDIEFTSEVPKRDVERFTKNLAELLPLFQKKEKRKRPSKDKDDHSPPLEYGGPGQEPVKWYSVHGRGNV
jgi:hypothetical protein